MRFTRAMKIAAAAAVAVGALAGVGQAAISTDGTVFTCVNSSTGAWRVVDPDGTARPCNTTETPLKLNQTGPQGPAGPTGAAGPAGPAGPSFVQARHVKKWLPGTEYLTAAKIEVGPGQYLVTAKGTAHMTEALGHEYWAAVACALRVREPNGDYTTLDTVALEVSDGGPEYGSFSLQGLLKVDAATARSARLQCLDDGGPGGLLVSLRNLRLHVQQVGGFTEAAG